MKKFFKSKYFVTVCLFVILIVMIFIALGKYESRQDIVYKDSLDMTAAKVNGTTLTLADVAFYVYYEEDQVNKQAVAYNPEDPNEYWNTYTDGQFMKMSARNAAIQMAVHDEIFYQMAVEEGITLSEEEQTSLANNQADVWADMTDEGIEIRLGITQEQINETLEKMIYAQKYQTIYALSSNGDYEDYNLGKEPYEELLEQQDYEINEKIWERVPFGKVTINYEVEE
ncbi:MAG: SurA N-terminal domain-containing protein [Agathobacter sp.]|nr:SurA N-terminal domain-containing protein [Agathobacter sp.]